MKTRFFVTALAAVLFITGCNDNTRLKSNITSYAGRSYALNYGFLETDKFSDGESYFLTVYLTSDATPSPSSGAYSVYTAPHTLVINIVSDSNSLTEGEYTFSSSNYSPFHFNYLQYYFLDINQYGFATSGTLEVAKDGAEYTFDLDCKASKFVGSNDTGETVSIRSHYEGTLTTF
ncbi:MAG: hypothetical protein ACOYXB_17655 [Bacteroidota bacterium]